jgi:hypothetical protein
METITGWVKVNKTRDGIPTPNNCQEWEYHNAVGGIIMSTRPKSKQPKDLKDPTTVWV